MRIILGNQRGNDGVHEWNNANGEEGETLKCGQEEKLMNKVKSCKRRKRIQKERFYGSKERRPFQGEWP